MTDLVEYGFFNKEYRCFICDNKLFIHDIEETLYLGRKKIKAKLLCNYCGAKVTIEAETLPRNILER